MKSHNHHLRLFRSRFEFTAKRQSAVCTTMTDRPNDDAVPMGEAAAAAAAAATAVNAATTTGNTCTASATAAGTTDDAMNSSSTSMNDSGGSHTTSSRVTASPISNSSSSINNNSNNNSNNNAITNNTAKIARLNRRKMHFVKPQNAGARPRRAGSRGSNATAGTVDTFYLSDDQSASDHTADYFHDFATTATTNTTTTNTNVGKTTAMDDSSKQGSIVMDESKNSVMDEGKPKTMIPPRRPQRKYSESDNDAETETSGGNVGVGGIGGGRIATNTDDDRVRETPSKTSSFAEIDVDTIDDGPKKIEAVDDDDDDDDADIIEEANKRSKFMMKGGAHSIQKVLKGEARKKKGLSRFDRRSIKANDGDSSDKPTSTVGADVLQALGDSYSESIDVSNMDGSDAEEFTEEVARRSKFIAKGGSHSIKKVLAGEARSGAKKSTGPSRIDRKKLSKSVPPLDKNNDNNADDGDDYEEEMDDIDTDADTENSPLPRRKTRTPIRTISVDSTDSQIEEEASRRSRFMLKGASHSIRNLLSGKAKKEKRGSALDRRKLNFKHQADAVHYTEHEHKTPAQINEERLKAEAEAKERDAARKAARSGVPRRPTRNKSFDNNDVPNSPKPRDNDNEKIDGDDDPDLDEYDDDDADIVAKSDRRAPMFKGGSHSIRKLFSGKEKKKDRDDGGIGRFDRRKLHFQKEAKAVHSKEKPRLTPAEINARHQEEAQRLRQQPVSTEADSDGPDDEDAAEKTADPRDSTVSAGSMVDIGDGPQSKQEIFDAIEVLHGTDDQTAGEYDTDDDIIEEANRRTNFMAKGGSYSIQKVLKGEARKPKGITRFDRRKMHFKHEAKAIHSHDHDGKMKSNTDKKTAGPARQVDDESDDPDADDDIIEEANKRSQFIMKGGSYSIQKVLRGEARVKKDDVTSFGRRKMHFKHESQALHSHDGEMASAAPKDHAVRAPQRKPSSASAFAVGGDDDSEEFDEEEIEMLREAEADPRKQMMLKGASHSIRNIFSGKAKKKKEAATGIERRKSQLKNASTRGRPGDDSEKDKASDVEDLDASIEREIDRRGVFSLKGASNSIRNLLSRKPGKKDKDNGKRAIDAEIERLQKEKANEKVDDKAREAKYKEDFASDDDLDDEDREIEEEASRRTNFMAKGASYSITKVLSGSARKKKTGISRLDRRKMHFKKEAAAAHSRGDDADVNPEKFSPSSDKAAVTAAELKPSEVDGEAADSGDESAVDAGLLEEANRRSKFFTKGGSHSIQKVVRGEARIKKTAAPNRFDRRSLHNKHETKVSQISGDLTETKDPPQDQAAAVLMKGESSDNPEQELDPDDSEDAELLEEVDRRSSFMGKGGSYSIQKVLRGEARAKKGVTRFDRRKMHFKKDSAAIHSHDSDADKASADTHPPSTRKPPPATRKPEAQAANARMPPRTTSEDQQPTDTVESTSPGQDLKEDTDEECVDADGESDNRRKRFTLKGASHSIKKVLSGKARTGKKDLNVSRLDRRRIHLKSKSTPRADLDVPSPPGKSPGKHCFALHRLSNSNV